MKRALKIIGIILLTVIIIVIIIQKICGSRPADPTDQETVETQTVGGWLSSFKYAAPTDYQTTVETGGDIEKNICKMVIMKYPQMRMLFCSNSRNSSSTIQQNLKPLTKNILLL